MRLRCGSSGASRQAVRERLQDHTAGAQEQGSDHAWQSGYVLGLSVHEFAPAVAALTDCEELVVPENDLTKWCSWFLLINAFVNLFDHGPSLVDAPTQAWGLYLAPLS